MNIILSTQKSLGSERRSLGKIFLTAILLLVLSQAYCQQSYTFTAAGAVGRYGPTQTQVNTAYQFTNLNGSVTIVTPGIQQFTVPSTGAYAIEAFGSQGYGLSQIGGRGAQIKGQFQLTAGQVLKIMVGQKGSISANVSYDGEYSGGGGTFVTDLSNVPFVVAGGGGANWSSAYSVICDAPVVTAGNTGGGVGSTGGTGGTGGSGGLTNSSADGGGGITGDGTGTAAGLSFVNGGTGGFSTYVEGGFGGGAGTSSYNNRRSGGGGGYSGGGGAHGGTTGFPEGGGGGSYNAGTNQVNAAGVNFGDGKVIITKLCNVSISAATNPMCFGNNVVLSTNAVSPISWSSGSSTSSSISVSPTVTTTYTVTGTGTGTLACVGSAAIVVTVTPLPNVSAMVNPPLLCVGGSATLTGSGASTYTWNAGPSGSTTVVNPVASTVYNFSGTNGFGCVNSGTVSVSVNTNSIGVSANTVICEGSWANIFATGAISYTWSTGTPLAGLLVSPTINTVYSVIGTDANNCQLTNSVSVSVNPSPNVIAAADKDIICKGESVVLSATGANAYAWTNPITGPATGASVPLTLLIDVPYTYTVTGTNANGCSRSTTLTIIVNKCSGIAELREGSLATIYPNPTNGIFVIEAGTADGGSVEISDMTGRLIATYILTGEKTEIKMPECANDLYFAKVKSGNSVQVIKVIKH